MTWHPSRAGKLWLPSLSEKILDIPAWGFPDPAEPRGFARLRMWRVDNEDDGCFAILTETGTGMTITAAAPQIYWRLRDEYPDPFGLAELHPEGRFGPLHLDLCQPAQGGRINYIRLYPTGLGGAVPGWDPDIAQSWMIANGAQILEP